MTTANRLFMAQLKACRASALALAEQNGALLESLTLMEAAVERQEKADVPRCPNCGSPKHMELTGMGGPREFQCLDCGTMWKL